MLCKKICTLLREIHIRIVKGLDPFVLYTQLHNPPCWLEKAQEVYRDTI